MKVGVLGVGSMGGTVIEHLKGCRRVKEIVAQDIRAERVQHVRDKYGIQATTNANDILADAKIPLVFITASNDAHKDLAMQAMAAGKSVMCEKPMANTLGDARAVMEEAQKRDAFLQIGFEYRYSKLYTKVKEWADAGLLGKIINCHCLYITSEFRGKGSWRLATSTGGSTFGEKLSHYVDLVRWWIGTNEPVKDVYSACSANVIPYYEVRDNYHTTYRFENGAVGHISFMMAVGASFNGDPQLNIVDQQQGDGHICQFVIEGTKGAAFTDLYGRRIKRWEFGDSPTRMTSKWVEDLSWVPDEDHFYVHNTTDQAHDIVRRVAEGLEPNTPVRDAYETMKLCFAAEESANRGEIVRLDELGA